MTKIFLALLVLILLAGCAPPPLKVTNFDPVPLPPKYTVFSRDNAEFISYDDPKYKITACLYKYENVFVISLSITNETGSDIKDYSIALFDGRDYKPLKMVSFEDITKFRSEYAGTSRIGSQDEAIKAALEALIEAVQPTSKKLVVKALDTAIDNYFELRPVYAHEDRSGIISFLVDFKLEYPITLTVRIGEERIDFKFVPPENTSS